MWDQDTAVRLHLFDDLGRLRKVQRDFCFPAHEGRITAKYRRKRYIKVNYRATGRVEPNLPDKMPPVRHCPYSAHGATNTGKFEGSSRFSKAFVEAVLIDSTISSACIDEIAVR